MAKKSSEGTLQEMMDEINKTFGVGTMQSFDGTVDHKIELLNSGSIVLNDALGGGYPMGRIVEIYGAESSGKTTLTLHAIAEAQKLGKAALFLDLENAFDPSYAEKLGVSFDSDKWVFSQPDCGEDAFSILEKFVSNPAIGIIVVDSIAAMTPRAEIEGEFGESKMGLHARLMSQGMRKLVGAIKKSNTLVIFINQTREKIGVMFGDPTTTTGGNAMKFYASQRLQVFKKKGLTNKAGEVETNEIRVKVIKNKIAPPLREANFQIRFGEGIDQITETINIASEIGIIEKKGAFYKFDGESIGQGMNNARDFLKDNPDTYEIIHDAVVDTLFME